MATRKAPITYDAAPIDGHLLAYSFNANDLANAGGVIESVTAYTTAGSTAFYRLRFCGPYPFTNGISGESHSAISGIEGEFISVTRHTGLVAPGGVGLPEEDREIDLILRDDSTAPPVTFHAGSTILLGGVFVLDMAAD